MSHPIGRVSSDLSHSSYSAATTGLHHQSTSNNDSINAKAKQRVSFLFSGVGKSRRSQSGGTADRTDQGGSKKRHAKGSNKPDIGQVLKKYSSMVEQLFASFSGGSGRERRWELRRRPHSLTSGGGWNAPSKRHGGRLSSAPASLRGSPENSGHLSVTKVSMSSEESTLEEIQSAIQGAIAHCKNSIAVAKQDGGDKCKY